MVAAGSGDRSAMVSGMLLPCAGRSVVRPLFGGLPCHRGHPGLAAEPLGQLLDGRLIPAVAAEHELEADLVRLGYALAPHAPDPQGLAAHLCQDQSAEASLIAVSTRDVDPILDFELGAVHHLSIQDPPERTQGKIGQDDRAGGQDRPPVRPRPARLPTAAEHQSVVAVFRPRTDSPSRRMTPAPMKPIPEATWAAMRVGLFSPFIKALMSTKPADPTATRALVRRPAGRRCHCRSTPMMTPSTNAVAMRVPSSMGVMPPPIQAALNALLGAGLVGRMIL